MVYRQIYGVKALLYRIPVKQILVFLVQNLQMLKKRCKFALDFTSFIVNL